MGNTLGDELYPDNPKRRNRVIQLTQKHYDYMMANFRATNRLSEYLSKHVQGVHFSPISVNEQQTIKFNCNVLTQRITEVQAIVKKIDSQLADKLDPALYRQLSDTDLSFEERIQTANNVLHVISGIVAAAAAVAVCVAISSGGVIAPVIASLGVVATSIISAVVISSIVGLELYDIFQVITGAIEREKLEHGIKELESSCERFVTGSGNYTGTIYEVLAELKIFF